MNLDKHDLFRNAVPGFIFLIVIFSYYFFSGKPTEYINPLLSFIAAFPLGFIIHALYRIIFHIWLREQDDMEKEEVEIVKNSSGLGKYEKESPKQIAHLLWFAMSEEENKNWKHRIDFSYSFIHALGGACLGIFLALASLIAHKAIHIKNFCFMCDLQLKYWLLGIIWISIGGIFYFGRKDIKKTCRISEETFAKVKIDTLGKIFKIETTSTGRG